MNRERAETHVRLLAEEGLRQVAARSAPMPPDEDPARWTHARLARVAQALSGVRAMDPGVAEEVEDDFELALTVRQPDLLHQVSPRRVRARHRARLLRHHARPPAAAGSGSSVFKMTGAGVSTSGFAVRSRLNRPQPPPVRPAPWRVTPVGRVIPIGGGDSDIRGELCLLAFAQTASGARFIMSGWLEQPAQGGPGPAGRGQRLRPPMPGQHLTAVDDQGAGYNVGFSGGGSSSDRYSHSEWEGALDVDPDPPDQIRWLNVTGTGGPVTRIDLAPRTPEPEITVIQADSSPGEVLLDRVAAELLVSAPGFAPARSRTLSATGLTGDIIAALRAAEALPPSSPVPGQLTWLAANLAGGEITAPPAGMPEPWLSMLAYHQRRPPRPAPAFCAAAVTAELPEIDGARIAILGLCNGSDGSIAHMLATGVEPDPDWPDLSGTGSMPALWLRDHRRQWHTTRLQGFNSRDDGEVILRLAIEPPLDRDTPWLELRATGQQEQVRARLVLRWI